MLPALSIIIPTYNRLNILRKTLDSLFLQSVDKEHFEIIVVDDGSIDGTSDFLAEIKRSSSTSIRTFHQENKLGGSARNLGIRKANGHIILLLDDDILASLKLVEKHLMLHTKYNETNIAVWGRVITGNMSVNLLDPDNRKIQIRGSTKDGYPLMDACYFTTQNVSFKREFIIKNGLFNEGLPALQDMELALRLKQKGLILVYCSEAIGTHTQPLDTLDKVINSGKKYGQTLAKWYEKAPILKKQLPVLGGRFNGGWDHLIHNPWQYFKDAIRRWIINRHTIDFIVRIASNIPISNPPKRVLTRLCREIWAYYYRHEFYVWRKQLATKESKS